MWYFINLTLFKFLFFLSILIWYHPCLFFWIYVFFISFNYLFFANFFLSFLFPLIFLFLYSYILSIDLSQIFYPTIFFYYLSTAISASSFIQSSLIRLSTWVTSLSISFHVVCSLNFLPEKKEFLTRWISLISSMHH